MGFDLSGCDCIVLKWHGATLAGSVSARGGQQERDIIGWNIEPASADECTSLLENQRNNKEDRFCRFGYKISDKRISFGLVCEDYNKIMWHVNFIVYIFSFNVINSSIC